MRNAKLVTDYTKEWWESGETRIILVINIFLSNVITSSAVI
jgi:hypothetical protein